MLPAVPVDLHVQPAKLGDHVRAARQLVDLRLPGGEHLVLLAGIGTDAERTAEVVENELRIRERPREADGVGELGVRAPDLEAQLAGAQMLEAGSKVVVQKQALGRVRAVVLDVGAFVPECPAPDPAKPAAACRNMRIQDIGRRVSNPQIDRADDPGGDPGLAVIPRRAHGGDAVHEFGLADASEWFGSVRLEHRPAFDEYSRDDVVPTRDIIEDLIQQIALLHRAAPEIPEMMMRIADGKVGLERLLLHFTQPGFVSRLRDHSVLPPKPTHESSLSAHTHDFDRYGVLLTNGRGRPRFSRSVSPL